MADSFPTDTQYVLAELTEQELRDILEDSLSHIVLGSDETLDEAASAWEGFLCISGFSYSYDASAPVGSRVYALGVDSGALRAAVPASCSGGVAVGTLREAASAYCLELETVVPPDTGRIRVLGANLNHIVGNYIPKGFVILIAAVAIIFSGARYRRRLNTER